MKAFLRRWLGLDTDAESVRAEFQARLEHTALTQASEYDHKLAEQKAAMQQEMEFRLGVILRVSISAADEISRTVASTGDTALKEYIDGVLNIFQSHVNHGLD